VHLDAIEHDDTIAFMHAVQEGAASKSYGLQVAALAGVPPQVIKAAKHKLHQLENRDNVASEQVPSQVSMNLLAPMPEPSPAMDKLAQINPDDLTPKQALDLLYELKRLAR
jgi:DNA mismatch repair protein MutS